MRRPRGPGARSRRATGVAVAAAAAVLAADQLTKWLVRRAADGLPRDLAWGVSLREVYNPGVSFGRFREAGDVVLVLVALLAAALAVALAVVAPRYRPGVGVLLGGALGNLVDRARFGAVLDFVDVPWWPTFNLADAAIVAGVAMVVVEVLRERQARRD